MSELAILGGPKAIKSDPKNIFAWPIITEEIEEAVLEVLRAGKMSGWDVTMEFEREYADWHGMTYGLGFSTGTAAIQAAMFGIGIGKGDEIICPSITYWASCLQVFSLGGTVVFAEIDPETLCIDPNDIEKRITKRTKAIIAVHYCAYPAEIDKIMEIARRNNLKVIEDCSHAHGALFKGKMVGTFGDVPCFSLMSGKSFACGEAGIMLTNEKEIYERAVIWGHYERHQKEITIPYLQEGGGLPWGGYKYRMHQLSAAVARVQLKNYPQQMKEIDKAMNYFCDLLEGLPGIRTHRPSKDSGSTKGGWYIPLSFYRSEELEGLSVTKFCEAVCAEGFTGCSPGCNFALHLHPVFNEIDIYKDGKPTRIANSSRDIRQPKGSLPISEGVQKRVFKLPWFKRYYPEIIEEYALAFKKVVNNYKELLPYDSKEKEEELGSWGLTFKREKERASI